MSAIHNTVDTVAANLRIEAIRNELPRRHFEAFVNSQEYAAFIDASVTMARQLEAFARKMQS